MKYKTIDVEITDLRPLLQHRFSDQAEAGLADDTKKVKKGNGLTPREVAELAAYRDKEGLLVHPSSAVLNALREAGSYHKQKGSRKSLKYIVPAAVLPASDWIELFHDQKEERLADFEVDSRSVVNQKVKARVVCHRARLEHYRARFRLQIDEDILDGSMIHQLLEEAGVRVGIGAFRVQNGGPFGTFLVTSWQEARVS